MTETKSNFSPTEQIKMAEEFRDTPFWRKVFEPHLKEKITECMLAFVNCNKDDLDKLQAAISIYNDLDNFIDDYIDSANTQIEIEKYDEKKPVTIGLDVRGVKVVRP